VDDAIKIANPSASRKSAFLHVYDLANNPLKTTHIDGGIKTRVIDGAGLPLESRDAKGALVVNSYDDLLCPVSMWARDVSGETATMRQHLVYGDSLTTPETNNYRVQVYKHYDEAGLTLFGKYDFKGNLLEKIRRVIKDSEILGVFSPAPTNWLVQAYRVDWTGLNESTLLETQEYETTMIYDGLSRPISVELPLDLDSQRKLVVPTYNRSGAMETISLDGEVYVSRIAYNAKGQRVVMAIGDPANFSNNGGIMTRFAYDPVNFRLLRQRSEKFTNPSGFPLTYEAVSGSVRQDCEYLFDLAGNIVNMVDDSPNAGIGGSGSLSRDFTYDALYRLLTATGREAGGFANSSSPWDDSFYVPDDSHANTRGYTRTYTYDQLGNMLKMNHNGGTGNTFNRWFNDYDVSTTTYHTSNLADKVKYGSTTITNSFDANGNMVSEGSSRHFEWDFADQMRVYRTQTGTSIPSEYAHYLYDAGGNRVKKIVWKQDGSSVVSVYVDGGFEHLYKRSSGGTKSEEHNELQVMDGRSRIASVRVGTAFSGDVSPTLRYNLEDHLGNASFTLDYLGSLTHRAEFFPFGETSFGSYTKKRYRFCGKERDEESGLYYYGARYYMPWQCRFVSVDPLAGEYPFYTPYQYAGNQPIISVDIDGLEGSTQNNSQSAEGSANPSTESQPSSSGKSLWGKISKAVKAQADGTNAASESGNLVPQEAIGKTPVFIAPDPTIPGIGSGIKDAIKSAPKPIPAPVNPFIVGGLTAAFVLLPLKTSSHDQPVVDYQKLRDQSPKSNPGTQPKPDEGPDNKPPSEPEKLKNFKLHLATVAPSSPKLPYGHSAVGLSTPNGKPSWYHQEFDDNGDAKFVRINKPKQVEGLEKKASILSLGIEEFRYYRAQTAAEKLVLKGSSQYSPETNNCVTTCQTVFKKAGFKPSGKYPADFQAWFRSIGGK
jgi:RHS repeat-associated protein